MTEDRKNFNDTDVTTRMKSWQDDDGKSHTSTVSRQSANEPEFPNCAWHPIDTAPKDGTEIDLWLVDETGDGCRKPDCYWCENLWADYNGPLSCKWGEATHWMPTPKPPK